MTGDRLLRGIAGDFRVAIAVTTSTTAEAVLRHTPTPVGAVALARGLTSLALAGITGKEWRRMSAQWVGRGELGTMQVDLQQPGALRGYFTGTGEADSVEASFGRGGLLSVLSQQPDGTFSQGQVALAARTVDADMEAYLRGSEQVASVLRVLVDVTPGDAPTAVTGILVQTLPGGDKVALRTMASQALLDRSLPAHLSVDDLMARGLPGLPPVTWMFEAPLVWECGCSRERIEAGIRLLGRAELTEMVDEQESTEVSCDFCAEGYHFSPEDIGLLRDGLEG